MSGSDYTTTPNLGLFMPNYDMDDGQWGFHLNTNAQVLDAAIGSATPGPWLPLAGGALSGLLTLSGPPTAALHAATKAYVDAAPPVGGPFLPLAGGTVTGATIFSGSVRHNSTVGFNNTAPIARPTVSGLKGSNAALGSLLAALVAYGLITDTTGT